MPVVLRQFRKNGPKHLPDEPPREWKPDIGTDADVLGEPQGQPACRCGALYNHDFGLERADRIRGDAFGEHAGERLEPVGVSDVDHRTVTALVRC